MISVGLALGSTEEIPLQYDVWREKGLRAVSPLSVQMHMPNSPAAAVGLDRQGKGGHRLADHGRRLGRRGHRRSVATDRARRGRYRDLRRRRDAHRGGARRGVLALGLLSTNNDDPPGACRPFDKDRDGMVLSEAGALMLIETEEHAKARGAPILARVMGAAMTSDGYDAVEPDPSGQAAGDAITHAIEWRAWHQATSTTSTPTPPGPPSVTWPRLAPSATRSATTSLRYMRPKRRWGIRWARLARWRRC